MKPSLAHDAEPEAYAEAMMRCQSYAPACSDLGECALDGWCFGRDAAGFKEARRQVVELAEAETNVFTRAWLKVALDALENHRFTGESAIDALKLVAINQQVRKQYKSQS